MKDNMIVHTEYVIIGMQTTLIFLFFLICIEPSLLAKLKEFLPYMEFIIVIPIAYVLGILIDRISELILDTKKIEKYIKKGMCKKKIPLNMREKFGCKNGENCRDCELNMMSKVVWSKCDDIGYYNDAKTRIRIIRATTLNSFVGALTVTILFFHKMSFLSNTISIALMACLWIIAVSCLYIYIMFVFEYYEKLERYIYLWKSGKM